MPDVQGRAIRNENLQWFASLFGHFLAALQRAPLADVLDDLEEVRNAKRADAG